MLSVASAGRTLAIDLFRAHGSSAMAVLENMMREEQPGTTARQIMEKASRVLRSLQGG
jgi:hypothetical protein